MKILAFFGADLDRRGPAYLKKISRMGYTVLALDVSAIGTAASTGMHYTLIDEWIDSEKMVRAKEEAAQCERKWFEKARQEFTAQGICWPEFDRHAMHWFWANVILASTFTEVFRNRGGQELMFFQNEVPRPAVFYSSSDTTSKFWEAELNSKAKALKITRNRVWHHRLRSIWTGKSKPHESVSTGSAIKSQELRNSDRHGWLPNSFSALLDKIVIALNPGEFYRFTPIIRQLSESHPRMVVAVLISPDQAKATKISAEWGIPVLCGPQSGPTDPGLEHRFLQGYAKASDAAVGHAWRQPLKHLQFHFKYYCRTRWPKLDSTFIFWVELWNRVRPKAVIVSSLQDSESQLPAEAAKRFAIPTFSVPHGAGMGRFWDRVSGDYVLYSLMTQKAAFERSGIPSERLIGCRNLVAQNEYPVCSWHRDRVQSSWRVLALTDPIGLSGNFAPHTSPRAQLAALDALTNPPSDIARKLSLTIKVHPKWPDIELLASLKTGLEKLALSPDSELRSVLQDTELVVAINYCGAALVHVLREGKPVVFFWTDYLMGRSEPHLYADMFLEAGILAGSQKEFWDSVRTFFTDREFAKQLRFKSYQYSDKNLNDSNYPTLSEVLQKTL